MTLKLFITWALRVALLAVAGFMLMSMKVRFALVNLQKLGEDTVANPPWYYLKFHCTEMYPGVSWSHPFCFAADLRIFLLIPLAVVCIGCVMWHKHDEHKAERSTKKGTRSTKRTR